MKVDLLLTRGAVVTMNGDFDVYPDGAIAVLGDSIVAVGPADELEADYQPEEIVECHGQVVIPGLVNAHTHVPMSLLRGLNDDLRLDVWLGYLMPLEREFVTPDFVRLGTQVACAEMIRSGITTTSVDRSGSGILTSGTIPPSSRQSNRDIRIARRK